MRHRDWLKGKHQPTGPWTPPPPLLGLWSVDLALLALCLGRNFPLADSLQLCMWLTKRLDWLGRFPVRIVYGDKLFFPDWYAQNSVRIIYTHYLQIIIHRLSTVFYSNIWVGIPWTDCFELNFLYDRHRDLSEESHDRKTKSRRRERSRTRSVSQWVVNRYMYCGWLMWRHCKKN